MRKHNINSNTNKIFKNISNHIPKELQTQTTKERLEVKLLLIGIKDIENNNLIDGEKILSNLEKKYNIKIKHKIKSNPKKYFFGLLTIA